MLLWFFFLIYAVPKIPTAAAAVYSATDFILLNCGGASTNLTDANNRSWESDERSSYAPPTTSSTSAATSASGVPYETARVFHSPYTYTFPVTTGSKFVRLHFCSTITDLDASESFFSVTANAFTLLSNFSAFMYSQNSSQFSFMKEFVINVQQNQQLNLTFFPSSENSFAFINGIEIISIPDNLYFRGEDVPIKFVDVNAQLTYLDGSTTALENVYRLNVGGSRVEIDQDSGPTGMFRAWSEDEDYLFRRDVGNTSHAVNRAVKYTVYMPQYFAPELVYTTARETTNRSIRLEWDFPVDSGFNYLLRLHFCEFNPAVTQAKLRVFMIMMNDIYAHVAVDVVNWAGGAQIPIFGDYIIWIPDDHDGSHGKKYLGLSLFPDLEVALKYPIALLNGLEIFKFSDEKGSLAGANPDVTGKYFPGTSVEEKTSSSKRIPVSYIAMGSAMAVLAVVGFLIFFIFRRQRQRKVKKQSRNYSTGSASKSSWQPLSSTSRSTTSGGSVVPPHSDLCRCFSFDEIRAATREFDRDFIIGRGGFGYVYRGLIDHGATTVAIKRLSPMSNQGAHEFLTEIQMLSKLRHRHLVSLIGYCDEHGEMILVYDYMARGSVRDHLHNSENSPLSWKQRLEICKGAAEGLHYLLEFVTRRGYLENSKGRNI